MFNSKSLPESPSLRESRALGGTLFGCSSIADAITTFEILRFSCLGPTHRTVKSRFNNSGRRNRGGEIPVPLERLKASEKAKFPLIARQMTKS
jgi:hypothetical protein